MTGMLPPAQARVLAALLRVHALGGRATVREVALSAGVSLSTCHAHLLGLRRRGLCAWEPGQQGTLRPLVRLERVA